MVLRPELLDKADVLVFKGKGIIGAFSDGKEHIAIVSDIFKTPGGSYIVKIIESHMDTTDDNGNKVSGIIEKTLNPEHYPKIEVYRLRKRLTNYQKAYAIDRTRKELVGKIKYAVEDFPSLWIYSKILQPIGLGNMMPKLNDKHREQCSTWPHKYFFGEYLGIDLFPGLNENCGIPGDYPKSKLLQRIC